MFDPSIAQKIQAKHGVSEQEVREAVLFQAYIEHRWDDHPHFGRRLLVLGRTYQGAELLVYLKPMLIRDGIWECKTAVRRR